MQPICSRDKQIEPGTGMVAEAAEAAEFRVSSHTCGCERSAIGRIFFSITRSVNRLLAEAEAKVTAGEGEALLSQKYYGFVPISASRCLPVVEASAGWARHVCGSQLRGVNRFASLVGRDGQPRLFPPFLPLGLGSADCSHLLL